MRKYKIYLSCPYEFESKNSNWKQEAMSVLGEPYEGYDPCPNPEEKNVSQSLKNEEAWAELEELGKEIIERDLWELRTSDGCLVYFPGQTMTTGTIHEVIDATTNRMPLVLIAPDGLKSLTTWLIGLVGLKNIVTNPKAGALLLAQRMK